MAIFELPFLSLSALFCKYYNAFYSNGIKMIHRRAAENAEGFGIFRLSLTPVKYAMLSFTKNLTGLGHRQTKTIMPPAIGSHAYLARRALVYSFSPFSAKRNKKIFLCELCASNERSEWAVKKI